MFCIYCGSKLEPGAKFCSTCGAKTEDAPTSAPNPEPTPNFNTNSNYSNNAGPEFGGQMDSNDTAAKIERFAPLATFVPLAMYVLFKALSFLWYLPFIGYGFGPGYVLYRAIFIILKIVFIALTAAATGGLIWVAATKKNPSNIWTWIAPIATFIAFLSCLLKSVVPYYNTAGKAIACILMLVALALGLELFARISLAKNPMDTPMNYGAAFSIYQNAFAESKAKSEAEKAANATDSVSSDIPASPAAFAEASYFDGDGITLFGYSLLAGLVCGITCGLAAPWMICMIYKWRIEHTVINGKRLTFNGTGGSLFGHWLLWSLLTVVTCGIYGLFVHVALRRWELEHTYIAQDSSPVVLGASTFDGGTLGYIGYSLLTSLLLLVTCGLGFPWAMCILQKWDTSHQVINGKHLKFEGSGAGFLGEYIIIFLLNMITCGIYSSWGVVRMNKYIIRHTNFVDNYTA